MKWLSIITIVWLLLLLTMTVYSIEDPIASKILQSVSAKLNESTICGNSICQEGESHLTCPEDCGQNFDEPNIFIYLLIGMFIYISTREKK